jgi:hypothetical protein
MRGDTRKSSRSVNRCAALADTAADRWAPLVSVFSNLNKPKICFLGRENLGNFLEVGNQI